MSVVALIRVTSLKDLRLLEDDFDGERPVTGYPPRLMLSASLPEIACGGTRFPGFQTAMVVPWLEEVPSLGGAL